MTNHPTTLENTSPETEFNSPCKKRWNNYPNYLKLVVISASFMVDLFQNFKGVLIKAFPPLCKTPTLQLCRSVLQFLQHQHLGQWRIRPTRWRCCHRKLPEEVATKLWQKWWDLGKGRYTQTWSACFISKYHINYPNIDQLHIAYLYIYPNIISIFSITPKKNPIRSPSLYQPEAPHKAWSLRPAKTLQRRWCGWTWMSQVCYTLW